MGEERNLIINFTWLRARKMVVGERRIHAKEVTEESDDWSER